LVPISTGCDEFCSYCIVPFARGKQENRKAEEILLEVTQLVKKGYKDIMLLGQNVNSWKNPDKSSPIKDFTDLLKAVDSINGNFWLTFLSSHPNYIDDSLIVYFRKSSQAGIDHIQKGKDLTKNNHIRPYINLAMQSGSEKILKKMNRKYTKRKFLEICKRFSNNFSELNLSTDIIVGFPEETSKDFDLTKEIFSKINFDMAYINKYSPREFTSSSLFEDTVSWQEKKKREKELTKILEKSALENNKKLLGLNTRMLVEKITDGNIFGKTFCFKDVQIKNPVIKVNVGEFLDITITNTSAFHLSGKLKGKI
jgi:tRNA-2-methylthio-N6-dimethylallyladenosine synthase